MSASLLECGLRHPIFPINRSLRKVALSYTYLSPPSGRPFLLIKNNPRGLPERDSSAKKSEVCLHSAPNDVICEQKLGPTQYRWQQFLDQQSNYGSVDRIDGNSMRHFACECARSFDFSLNLEAIPPKNCNFPDPPYYIS